MQQSPNSSVGSKSSNGLKDIQFRYYQHDEGCAEILRTSWIRRLNLRPTSPIETNKDDPPPISPPTAVNSPTSAGSGASVLCHRTTISTIESRTQSSIYDTSRKIPFLDRLLKHQKDKPSLKTDPENCSFLGFGPFQVKNKRGLIDSDKVTALSGDDDYHLMRDGSGFQKGNGNCEIRDVRWDFNDTRNSCGNGCSRIVEEKDEEQNRENWLSRNYKTLFTGKLMVSTESNFPNNSKMGSFPDRRITDDGQRIPLSPFFRNFSASKRRECLRENMPDQISTKNECHFDPSVEEKNKFINSDLKSQNMNNPGCSSSSRALVAGDRGRCEQLLSVDQWPMYRVSHGISYLSRTGGITFPESCDDGGASIISRDPQLTRYDAVLRQHERHAPSNPNETDKPSSFWNMNRFQRAEMVTSIFQSFRTSSKKRNPEPDEFVSVKSRKLGTEG